MEERGRSCLPPRRRRQRRRRGWISSVTPTQPSSAALPRAEGSRPPVTRPSPPRPGPGWTRPNTQVCGGKPRGENTTPGAKNCLSHNKSTNPRFSNSSKITRRSLFPEKEQDILSRDSRSGIGIREGEKKKKPPSHVIDLLQRPPPIGRLQTGGKKAQFSGWPRPLARPRPSRRRN